MCVRVCVQVEVNTLTLRAKVVLVFMITDFIVFTSNDYEIDK